MSAHVWLPRTELSQHQQHQKSATPNLTQNARIPFCHDFPLGCGVAPERSRYLHTNSIACQFSLPGAVRSDPRSLGARNFDRRGLYGPAIRKTGASSRVVDVTVPVGV